MNRLLAAAASVALGVTLAGCGSSSRPQVDPDLAGIPTWAGCHGRSIANLDYVSDAGGKPTARAALAPYRSPGDHVVVVPARAHQNRAWMLVDDADVIHASVELLHGPHGWLVSTVERCAP